MVQIDPILHWPVSAAEIHVQVVLRELGKEVLSSLAGAPIAVRPGNLVRSLPADDSRHRTLQPIKRHVVGYWVCSGAVSWPKYSVASEITCAMPSESDTRGFQSVSNSVGSIRHSEPFASPNSVSTFSCRAISSPTLRIVTHSGAAICACCCGPSKSCIKAATQSDL